MGTEESEKKGEITMEKRITHNIITRFSFVFEVPSNLLDLANDVAEICKVRNSKKMTNEQVEEWAKKLAEDTVCADD